MSHPSLGKPPRSLSAGFPDGAARLRANRGALAVRALEVAVDADPGIRGRYDEAGLRNLLRDAEVLIERVALCVAGDDTYWLAGFADQTATVFRRRPRDLRLQTLMKGRLTIFVTVAVVLVVLVALNAASYVRVEQEGEQELRPDRSTENAGPTGTRALFDYLREGGHDVVRWTRPPRALSGGEDAPATFVVVGALRREVERAEAEAILEWVGAGGRWRWCAAPKKARPAAHAQPA